MKNIIFLILSLSILPLNFFSQDNVGLGTPFLQNYNEENYEMIDQVWSVIEDKRGIMYFGRNSGVIEFDGSNWRSIEIANKSVVRSLAMNNNTGRIYVGAKAEIGYLQSDSIGLMQYVSLLNKIPEAYQDFEDVWKTFVINNRVFFMTYAYVFILENNNIKVVKAEKWFHGAFSVNNNFYVREHSKGLHVLSDDSLKLIEQSEQFANVGIYVMLPYEEDKIMLISGSDGVFIYSPENNEEKFEKLSKFNELDKFLIKHQIYCGTKLSKDQFVLGTFQNGIIVIDKNGNIIQHLNKKKGLLSQSVFNLYVDSKKNIWAGLRNGISYLIVNSQFTHFDEKNGLEGGVYCTKIHHGQLNVGTSQGLFQKKQQDNFTMLENTKGQNWDLIEIRGELLVGYSNGIDIIKDGITKNIITNTKSVWKMLPYLDENYLLAGTYNGLYLLEYDKGNWKPKHKIEGFNENARYIEFENKNIIWVSHVNKGVFRLKLNATLDSVAEINRFDSKNGLPDNSFNHVFKIKDENQNSQIVFGTQEGIYKFNLKTNSFEPYKKYNQYIDYKGPITEFEQDEKGNIFFLCGEEHGVLLAQDNGAFRLKSLPFLKNKGLSVQTINIIDSARTLFSCSEGLVLYNNQINLDAETSYPSAIRQVFAKDSLIFGGVQNNAKKPELPYQYNNLKFAFSALFYQDHDKTEYSYFLDGFSDEWSEWTLKTEKEYTNLPEGNYVFKVKAINVYDKESAIAEYEFEILAPWYRTYWAYSGYFIAAVLFVFVLIRLNSLRLIKEKKKLEAIIIDRTSEIIKKNAKLKHEREFLQILMDTNPNPQYYKDENGKYIGCNQSFVNITGLPKNEILGKTYKEIPILNTNTDHENVDKKLLKTGEIKKYQTSIIFSDNINRDFEIIKTGYKNSDNKMGILGIMIDISHIKEQERIILAQEKEIHNKEREELEKNISEMTFQLIQNNQYINKFIHDLAVLSEYSNKDGNRIIRSLSLEYKNIIEDKNWERFEILFKKNYPEYFNKIQYNFPDLTQNDKKVCMMVFLNFSSKDIATATLKSIRTIESTRLRVRKKIKIIGENVELSTFLKSL